MKEGETEQQRGGERNRDSYQPWQIVQSQELYNIHYLVKKCIPFYGRNNFHSQRPEKNMSCKIFMRFKI